MILPAGSGRHDHPAPVPEWRYCHRFDTRFDHPMLKPPPGCFVPATTFHHNSLLLDRYIYQNVWIDESVESDTAQHQLLIVSKSLMDITDTMMPQVKYR